MKDSLSFPLVLATVLAGALLAVFDPANRTAMVAEAKTPATLSTSATQPEAATTHHLPS